MFIKLSSSNTNLSWVISKNPDTKMTCRTIRTGYSFGWFVPENAQVYCLHYADAPQKSAYSKDNFSYLDTTVFFSPYAALNLLHEYLRSALKNKHEKDVQTKNELSFFCTISNTRYVDFFNKSFEEFNISTEKLAAYNYRVIITANSSIHRLLNFASIFLLFCALFDENTKFYAEESLLDKYLECLSVVKVPYFISYLFKVHFIRSPERLETYQQTLQEATAEECFLTYGNTLQQRKDWIFPQIKENKTGVLVDLGCGFEANYLSLAKFVDHYIPIDIDPEVRAEVNRKIEYKQIENATQVYESWNAFKFSEYFPVYKNITVLATEVFEHMPFEDACQLLDQIKNSGFVNKIIITLPNKAFNKFYGLLDTESRHSDHDWEPTLIEAYRFSAFKNPYPLYSWVYDLRGFGDEVEGLSPSIGIILERNG